jgi:UDP-GlcNAc:undecaprenyl-phosphate GlcNAc-1-phosphate transferase
MISQDVLDVGTQGGLCFLVTAIFSVVATIVTCHVAAKVGLVDHPDNRRKTHPRPVPLGGGAAVFIATVLGLLVCLGMQGKEFASRVVSELSLAALGVAALWIVLVGVWDDSWGLRGRHKLLAQLVAAGFLVATGFFFDKISIFGQSVDLGILAVPFVMFWFLGAMNAVNLLDGADGFAGTIGLLMTIGLGLLAAAAGRPEASLVAFTFAGAILGFLIFNLPPARIFLGDAGSMLVGLVIAALSIKASLKGAGTLLLAAPLALWTIPILDCLAAIIRRTLTGKSIYSTDRAHIHHRLLNKLGSNRLLLVVIGAIGLISAIGALGSIIWNSDWIALLSIISVVTILVVGDLFGRGELYLLLRSLRRLAQPLIASPKNSGNGCEDSAVHIQGSVNWEPLWDEIRQELQGRGVESLYLDLNITALGESFHGRWPETTDGEGEEACRICVIVPLMLSEVRIGTLRCECTRRNNGEGDFVAALFDYAQEVENRIARLLEATGSKRELSSAGVTSGSAQVNGSSKYAKSSLLRRIPR